MSKRLELEEKVTELENDLHALNVVEEILQPGNEAIADATAEVSGAAEEYRKDFSALKAVIDKQNAILVELSMAPLPLPQGDFISREDVDHAISRAVEAAKEGMVSRAEHDDIVAQTVKTVRDGLITHEEHETLIAGAIATAKVGMISRDMHEEEISRAVEAAKEGMVSRAEHEEETFQAVKTALDGTISRAEHETLVSGAVAGMIAREEHEALVAKATEASAAEWRKYKQALQEKLASVEADVKEIFLYIQSLLDGGESSRPEVAVHRSPLELLKKLEVLEVLDVLWKEQLQPGNDTQESPSLPDLDSGDFEFLSEVASQQPEESEESETPETTSNEFQPESSAAPQHVEVQSDEFMAGFTGTLGKIFGRRS